MDDKRRKALMSTTALGRSVLEDQSPDGSAAPTPDEVTHLEFDTPQGHITVVFGKAKEKQDRRHKMLAATTLGRSILDALQKQNQKQNPNRSK